jgi:hypothetical protein
VAESTEGGPGVENGFSSRREGAELSKDSKHGGAGSPLAARRGWLRVARSA